MNRQVYIKAEQIARMRVKGIPMTRIAIEMGMSYDGLVRITRDPEFLKIEESVRNFVTTKMDARLEKRALMEEEVEDAVPEAMQVLLDQVRKKRDLRAALEVLDRDPQRQFAKSNPKPVNPRDPMTGLPEEILRQTTASADTTRDQIGRSVNNTLNNPPQPSASAGATNPDLPN